MAYEINVKINLDSENGYISVVTENEDVISEKVSSLLPKSTFGREDDNNKFFMTTPFAEQGINFVAIDLETATFERNSICELGLAIVENSKVTEKKSWLIQPPYNEYDDFNIEIHGIHPKDTKNCPEFKDVWNEIKPYLEGKIVIAHNCSFDMYVLRDTFLANDIDFPHFAFFCSYRTATKTVQNCYSYALPNVCEALGIDFSGHHRAENDAVACAEVFLACLKKAECNSWEDLQSKCEFRCGRFDDKYFRSQLSTHPSKSFKVGKIKGDPSKIDEGSYFYGKRVCFTGTCKYGVRKDLLQKIADIGGVPTDSVTKTTDILIVGQQDYRVVGEDGMSSKQKKAISLKDEGYNIEIMSESDFLNNI